MTDLETMLYTSLRAYPCRCMYKRTPSGQPVFDTTVFTEGGRVLERQCSRCAAVASYESHGQA